MDEGKLQYNPELKYSHGWLLNEVKLTEIARLLMKDRSVCVHLRTNKASLVHLLAILSRLISK